jgi:excisionase family DNA binding protein
MGRTSLMMNMPTPLQEQGVDHGSLRPLLTVQQVMAMLHLRRTKVYDLIACEALPAIHFGRVIRVSQQDVETLLASSKVQPNDEQDESSPTSS